MPTPPVRCPTCGARNRIAVDARGKPRCGKCHADLPWLADVDGDQFSTVVTSSVLPILVDLWAPWCGPCQTIAPALVELSEELAGSIRVVKVNVDQAPTLQANLKVQGIPTMVVFDRGVEVARQVGALPKDSMRRWIDRVLEATAANR